MQVLVIVAHIDLLRSALVVVHLNWWGAPPAIAKGWIDRAFALDAAYAFEKDVDQGDVPVGLLPIRAALVLNTSNTPEPRERDAFSDPLARIWRCRTAGLARRSARGARRYAARCRFGRGLTFTTNSIYTRSLTLAETNLDERTAMFAPTSIATNPRVKTRAGTRVLVRADRDPRLRCSVHSHGFPPATALRHRGRGLRASPGCGSAIAGGMTA